MKEKLQIEKQSLNERYLGLPAHVIRSKGSTFAYLKDMGTYPGVERKDVDMGRKGDPYQSSGTSNTYVRNGLLRNYQSPLCDQISSMICRYWWKCGTSKKANTKSTGLVGKR